MQTPRERRELVPSLCTLSLHLSYTSRRGRCSHTGTLPRIHHTLNTQEQDDRPTARRTAWERIGMKYSSRQAMEVKGSM